MITFKKCDNKEEMMSCNSCHNYKEHTLYELLIGFGNSGQLMYLCPNCAKELKKKIKIKTKYVIKQYDTTGRLVERYDNYTSLELAEKDVEWCKRVDEKENENYVYEIVEEEQ